MNSHYYLFMHSLGDRLELELRRRGVLAAREAADALGISQPTVSRLFAGMGRQRLLRLGAGRSTRYALMRSVRNLGSMWPLYSVAADGSPHLIGRLHALEAGQWYLAQDEPWDTLRGSAFRDGVYPGLPWFVFDLRPQGFLGRCFAHNYAPPLGAPLDPRSWADDDVVAALLQFGDDLPGNLVLGEPMVRTVQMRIEKDIEAIAASDRAGKYPARADAMLADEWPGSSAAGEQPKFTACVRDAAGAFRRVIVKFSGKGGRPEDRRWADLLVAEHVANTVLREGNIPSSDTTVLEAGGRTFLESTRFDRMGAHGRRGLVSLEAMDAAFFGQIGTPWTGAADRLRGDSWISGEDAERLALLWWFGTLIGNTDMHYGNVSLLPGPARPLALAPTYDMVPMQYRPDIEGRCSDDPVNPAPPPPEAARLWSRAADMAHAFWSRLAGETRASESFRHLAGQNARVVLEQHKRYST